jgi:hypothetical protein
MEKKIKVTNKGIVVIEFFIEKNVIGIIDGIKAEDKRNTYYINNLYVSIAYRRKRHGTNLIKEFAKYIYEKENSDDFYIELDDCTGHNPKNNIYSKLGFLVENKHGDNYISIHESDYFSEKRYIQIKQLLDKN